jgi:hypothetical protein
MRTNAACLIPIQFKDGNSWHKLSYYDFQCHIKIPDDTDILYTILPSDALSSLHDLKYVNQAGLVLNCRGKSNITNFKYALSELLACSVTF